MNEATVEIAENTKRDAFSPMKPSIRKQVRRHRFDFEVGYVVKSPCRRCPEHRIFPKCLKSCKIIDDLQTMICETVSCSYRE